jgi:hypothetical protein
VKAAREDADDGPERGGVRRPILIVVALAPIVAIGFFFAFMARSEVAFDEERCPYGQDGEQRLVRPGVAVRRDARSCAEGVEEQRWVLLREGSLPVELGRRRLEARYFEGQTWSVSEEEGRVRLEIRNPGLEPRVFREWPDGGVR